MTSGRSIPESPKLLRLCLQTRPGKSVSLLWWTAISVPAAWSSHRTQAFLRPRCRTSEVVPSFCNRKQALDEPRRLAPASRRRSIVRGWDHRDRAHRLFVSASLDDIPRLHFRLHLHLSSGSRKFSLCQLSLVCNISCIPDCRARLLLQ